MRNLKIEELFLGAWVQLFEVKNESKSKILPVHGIWWDGPLEIVEFGEKLGDWTFELSLDKVYPIPIDSRTLEGFGFVKTKGENVWKKVSEDMSITASLRLCGGVEECRRCAISGKIACWDEEIRYMHELQRLWNNRVLFPFNIPLDLTWRGIKERKEEFV